MNERVLLGRIGAAHGLKGEVKIATFTARPEDIASYGPLTSEDGEQTFEIASLQRASGGSVIARLRGVTNRTEAEKLRGTGLYVLRQVLPPAGDDEFYYSDLIGLAAISVEGEPLGEIVAVQNYGAGDLLEIRPARGGQTELVPFERSYVPTIDLAAGCVTVVRPVYEAAALGDEVT